MYIYIYTQNRNIEIEIHIPHIDAKFIWDGKNAHLAMILYDQSRCSPSEAKVESLPKHLTQMILYHLPILLPKNPGSSGSPPKQMAVCSTYNLTESLVNKHKTPTTKKTRHFRMNGPWTLKGWWNSYIVNKHKKLIVANHYPSSHNHGSVENVSLESIHLG